MPKLVPITCPNCAAPIRVDEGSTTVHCDYCETSSFVKPARQALPAAPRWSTQARNAVKPPVAPPTPGPPGPARPPGVFAAPPPPRRNNSATTLSLLVVLALVVAGLGVMAYVAVPRQSPSAHERVKAPDIEAPEPVEAIEVIEDATRRDAADVEREAAPPAAPPPPPAPRRVAPRQVAPPPPPVQPPPPPVQPPPPPAAKPCNCPPGDLMCTMRCNKR